VKGQARVYFSCLSCFSANQKKRLPVVKNCRFMRDILPHHERKINPAAQPKSATVVKKIRVHLR
jgi:hypothetical protein